METRTITQTKYFDIKANGQILSGHGYCDELPTIWYHKQAVWESEEQCKMLLKQAHEQWEKEYKQNPWGVTGHEPKLVVYWE